MHARKRKNITFSNNSFKSFEGAERSSKIISPDVPSIYHSSKEIFSLREITLDQVKGLGSTNQIKTKCSNTLQRGEGLVLLGRNISKVGFDKNIQAR